MKIQFTDSVAGPRFAYRMGEKIDLPDDVARGFIKTRQAVPFNGEIETATLSAPENAAAGRKSRKRGGIGGLFR